MGNPGKFDFYKIFSFDQSSNTFTPLYNIRIAGILYPKLQPIPHPINFGGINLYNYVGKSIAGSWDSQSKILDILGFFS